MSDVTMMQRVGAAILLAEQEWNPKRALESKEVVMARAAIAAMREPTEAVAREAFNHVSTDDWLDFLRGWRAMIAAALAE